MDQIHIWSAMCLVLTTLGASHERQTRKNLRKPMVFIPCVPIFGSLWNPSFAYETMAERPTDVALGAVWCFAYLGNS